MSAWLRDRIGWDAIAAALSAHRAPRRSFVFYLGGITLFAFAVQVASGVLLMLHYQPDAARAHASVVRIAGEVPYGDLVRGIHAWAADLFVLSLFAHALTVVVRRTYRAPHELTWISGVVSIVVGLGMAFTGAILPWSERAYTQARVGSELARHVPLVGEWLRRFLRGGDEVTTATLERAFGFHVAVLPATLTAIALVHVFLVSRRPPLGDAKRDETIPYFPDFLVRQAVALTAILVALMTLAIFVERSPGVPADPRVSPIDARPPWYFLPVHQIVRAAPRELLGIDGATFLVGAACVVALAGAALPFLDPRGSKVTAWAAVVLAFTLAILGLRALG